MIGIIDKPWGEQYLLYEDGSTIVELARMDPWSETSMHYHAEKGNHFTVIEGAVTVQMHRGDHVEVKTLTPGTGGFFVPAGVWHRMFTHDLSAKVIEVYRSHSKIRRDDIIRIGEQHG